MRPYLAPLCLLWLATLPTGLASCVFGVLGLRGAGSDRGMAILSLSINALLLLGLIGLVALGALLSL